MQAILNVPKLGAFVISAIVVAMFCFVIGWILMRGPTAPTPMLEGLVGALTGQFVLVVGFWIGSSASSKDKDDIIAKQADTSATATAVAAQAAGVKQP